MLPFCLDCPFVIDPSVFSYVYLCYLDTYYILLTLSPTSPVPAPISNISTFSLFSVMYLASTSAHMDGLRKLTACTYYNEHVDTKMVIRTRKSKKYRQHIGQNKKDKMKRNDQQNIHIKRN